MMGEYAIGIDLGTTNTCVAVLKHNKSNSNVEIINNEMGCKVTPSWVAFTDSEHLVGDAAKSQASLNPENTIFEAKRLIGRKVNEPEVQSKLKNWPFSVVKDVSNGNPSYEVTYMNNRKVMAPEQISAMVLTEMKKSAEEYLGCPVTQAVITVPAYFNDSQRQATIDAGEIAGLEVLEIINEPTAAAIAYGFDRKSQHETNVLVFDLGGGTFDIAIIGITDNDFDVKAIKGNKDLGGGDIDNLLVEHFVKKFKVAHEVDLMKNLRAISRLRNQCEIAKCHLSSSLKQKIHVDSIHEGLELDEWLSSVKLEDICSDLFDKVIDPLEAALNDAGMTKDQIDEVILVGGSTRIPSIQTRVTEFFDGKKLNKSVNPDEAVAIGAAIWAAKLAGDTGLDEVNLSDVIPISLGIAVRNKDMSVIIPQNTKIPTTKTREYSTHTDNQTCVKIEVFNGENEKCADNDSLGEFILNNIEQAERGIPRIYVKFHVDRNGILTVSAEDRAQKGCKNTLQIDSYTGRLNQGEIDAMVVEAQNLNLNKDQIRTNQSARNELESFASKMKRGCTKRYKKKTISLESFKKIDSACLEVLEWLEDNSDSSATESEQKLNTLREFCMTALKEGSIDEQSTSLA